MMRFLEDLAARRRFGMKPGLGTIRALCAALGDPQKRFRAIHVAGTNGKGAVVSLLDACLRECEKANGRLRVGRYTSPHLVQLNERFFLDGVPVDDATLDRLAAQVAAIPPSALVGGAEQPIDLSPTFFEALTAVAFLLYAEAQVDYAVLETGLGGRLDATNVCEPALSVITRIGLDHCDWLGHALAEIAAEKAGIVKPGVPVVLARNEPEVRAVVEARAREVGAPFFYAPDLATDGEIPADFALQGGFNRENAVTALASLKALGFLTGEDRRVLRGFAKVVWPGRFQRVGRYLVDGAHNPPAARALVASLEPGRTRTLVFGACGDKDVDEVLAILAPHVARARAVRTNNPRSLDPEALAAKMNAAGIPTVPCASLAEALAEGEVSDETLVCGSLFLAGEALVALGAYTGPQARFDPSEQLRSATSDGEKLV